MKRLHRLRRPRACQEVTPKLPLTRDRGAAPASEEATGTPRTGTGTRKGTPRKRTRSKAVEGAVRPYSITARTSPLETAAPSATFSSVDLAGAVGGDLVLHLHRLDHADQVALGDLGALLDRDLEHRSLQRRGQRLARGARAAARLALALRRPFPPPAPAPRPRGRLADHLDVEELAGDLDLVVAGDDLGALRALRRAAPPPARSSSATSCPPSGRGRSPPSPTARWRGSRCGTGSGWSGRRSRTRPAPAACAASPARGRRPRRSAWRPSGRTSASPRSRPRPPSRPARPGPPARGRT